MQEGFYYVLVLPFFPFRIAVWIGFDPVGIRIRSRCNRKPQDGLGRRCGLDKGILNQAAWCSAAAAEQCEQADAAEEGGGGLGDEGVSLKCFAHTCSLILIVSYAE